MAQLAVDEGAPADGPWTSDVLCARSAEGSQQAWISAREGLRVFGWPRPGSAPLALGRAAEPRFLPDGRLVFETSRDDGHDLLWRQAHVLDPDSRVPRAPRPGEDLGRWTAPAPLDDTLGDGGESGPAPLPLGATPIRVAIDAGHGGADPGALGNGLQEKDLSLAVALELAALLATDTADVSGGGEWEVLLTRVDDSDVSLLERVTMANAFGAQSFLSIHANAFTSPAANGTETYAWAEGTTAAALRDAVHLRMLQAWGLTDRGTKTAGFYVLLNTSMPAELSEMGFVTSPVDAVKLGDADALDDMALAHLFGLQQHHGVSIHEPTLFSIVIGGTYGQAGKPSLLASGPLTAGSILDLGIIDGPPGALAVLFMSLTSMPIPLVGGTFHAHPVTVQFVLFLDGQGSFEAAAVWPAGVPPGTSTWYQVAVQDAFVAGHGVSLSDALLSVSP